MAIVRDNYDDDQYVDGDVEDCWFCGGEKVVDGDRMGDPMWYDDDEFYRCPCCNGSGLAKDCTFW